MYKTNQQGQLIDANGNPLMQVQANNIMNNAFNSIGVGAQQASKPAANALYQQQYQVQQQMQWQQGNGYSQPQQQGWQQGSNQQQTQQQGWQRGSNQQQGQQWNNSGYQQPQQQGWQQGSNQQQTQQQGWQRGSNQQQGQQWNNGGYQQPQQQGWQQGSNQQQGNGYQQPQSHVKQSYYIQTSITEQDVNSAGGQWSCDVLNVDNVHYILFLNLDTICKVIAAYLQRNDRDNAYKCIGELVRIIQEVNKAATAKDKGLFKQLEGDVKTTIYFKEFRGKMLTVGSYTFSVYEAERGIATVSHNIFIKNELLKPQDQQSNNNGNGSNQQQGQQTGHGDQQQDGEFYILDPVDLLHEENFEITQTLNKDYIFTDKKFGFLKTASVEDIKRIIYRKTALKKLDKSEAAILLKKKKQVYRLCELSKAAGALANMDFDEFVKFFRIIKEKCKVEVGGKLSEQLFNDAVEEFRKYAGDCREFHNFIEKSRQFYTMESQSPQQQSQQLGSNQQQAQGQQSNNGGYQQTQSHVKQSYCIQTSITKQEVDSAGGQWRCDVLNVDNRYNIYYIKFLNLDTICKVIETHLQRNDWNNAYRCIGELVKIIQEAYRVVSKGDTTKFSPENTAIQETVNSNNFGNKLLNIGSFKNTVFNVNNCNVETAVQYIFAQNGLQQPQIQQQNQQSCYTVQSNLGLVLQNIGGHCFYDYIKIEDSNRYVKFLNLQKICNLICRCLKQYCRAQDLVWANNAYSLIDGLLKIIKSVINSRNNPELFKPSESPISCETSFNSFCQTKLEINKFSDTVGRISGYDIQTLESAIYSSNKVTQPQVPNPDLTEVCKISHWNMIFKEGTVERELNVADRVINIDGTNQYILYPSVTHFTDMESIEKLIVKICDLADNKKVYSKEDNGEIKFVPLSDIKEDKEKIIETIKTFGRDADNRYSAFLKRTVVDEENSTYTYEYLKTMRPSYTGPRLYYIPTDITKEEVERAGEQWSYDVLNVDNVHYIKFLNLDTICRLTVAYLGCNKIDDASICIGELVRIIYEAYRVVKANEFPKFKPVEEAVQETVNSNNFGNKLLTIGKFTNTVGNLSNCNVEAAVQYIVAQNGLQQQWQYWVYTTEARITRSDIECWKKDPGAAEIGYIFKDLKVDNQYYIKFLDLDLICKIIENYLRRGLKNDASRCIAALSKTIKEVYKVKKVVHEMDKRKLYKCNEPYTRKAIIFDNFGNKQLTVGKYSFKVADVNNYDNQTIVKCIFDHSGLQQQQIQWQDDYTSYQYWIYDIENRMHQEDILDVHNVTRYLKIDDKHYIRFFDLDTICTIIKNYLIKGDNNNARRCIRVLSKTIKKIYSALKMDESEFSKKCIFHTLDNLISRNDFENKQLTVGEYSFKVSEVNSCDYQIVVNCIFDNSGLQQQQQTIQPQAQYGQQNFLQQQNNYNQQYQQTAQTQAYQNQQNFGQQQNIYNQQQPNQAQAPQGQQNSNQNVHYKLDKKTKTLTFFEGYGSVIKEEAFITSNKEDIEKVICSNDITEIGVYAFHSCDKLVQIEAPSVETIGDVAFSGDRLLEKADFPNVKNIKGQSFMACKKLAKICFPTLETIEFGAFMGAGLLEISETDMPNVTKIEDNAFVQCKDLTKVRFPMLETINGTSFAESGLSEINEADFLNVTKIEYEAFDECKNLTKVCLPKVEDIGYWAFRNCEKLTYVNIPNIKEIDEETFVGCEALSEIHTGTLQQCKLIYNKLIKEETMSKKLKDGSLGLFYSEVRYNNNEANVGTPTQPQGQQGQQSFGQQQPDNIQPPPQKQQKLDQG